MSANKSAQWYPPVRRWTGDIELNSGAHQTIDVVPEEGSTFTGLYNAEGNPIHRPRNRVGFL